MAHERESESGNPSSATNTLPSPPSPVTYNANGSIIGPTLSVENKRKPRAFESNTPILMEELPEEFNDEDKTLAENPKPQSPYSIAEEEDNEREGEEDKKQVKRRKRKSTKAIRPESANNPNSGVPLMTEDGKMINISSDNEENPNSSESVPPPIVTRNLPENKPRPLNRKQKIWEFIKRNKWEIFFVSGCVIGGAALCVAIIFIPPLGIVPLVIIGKIIGTKIVLSTVPWILANTGIAAAIGMISGAMFSGGSLLLKRLYHLCIEAIRGFSKKSDNSMETSVTSTPIATEAETQTPTIARPQSTTYRTVTLGTNSSYSSSDIDWEEENSRENSSQDEETANLSNGGSSIKRNRVTFHQPAPSLSRRNSRTEEEPNAGLQYKNG